MWKCFGYIYLAYKQMLKQKEKKYEKLNIIDMKILTSTSSQVDK